MGRLAQLTRFRLTGFVALSAATGYALSADTLSLAVLWPAFGCMLLSAGASALNQYQERHWDALMERTRERPLPAARVAPRRVLQLSALRIALGLAVLLAFCGVAAAALGALAIVHYNGFYTWAKRRTAFAAVPGALVGSLAPAIGWVAAGGALGDVRLLGVAAAFYMWQVPHFWLLALRHAADYRRAGFPSPCGSLGRAGLGRVVFVWMIASAAVCLALPLFGFLRTLGLYLGLCAAALALGLLGSRMLRARDLSDRWLRLEFSGLNLFVLVMMLLRLVDRGMRP